MTAPNAFRQSQLLIVIIIVIAVVADRAGRHESIW